MSLAIRCALLGACLAVASASAGTLPASPTLSDFLRIAEAQSPALLAARRDRDADVEAIRTAGSFPDPRVTFGWFGEEVETRVGPQEWRIGVRQRLPWSGTRGLAGEVARREAEAAGRRFDEDRFALRAGVLRAWAELLHQREEERRLAEDVTLLEELLEVVEERYRVSTARYADVVRLRVETERMRTRLAAARDRRAPLVARMNGWLDRPASASLPDSLVAQELPAAPAVEDLAARLTGNAPRLCAREAEVARAEASRALAARSRWPDLDVGIDWIRTGDALDPSLDGSGRDPWMVSVGVELPIFRGKHDGPVATAAARLEAAEARRRAESAELHAQAGAALAAWRDADRRLTLHRDRLVPETAALLETTWTAYANGAAGITDVVDVQRTTLELRLAEADARRDRAAAIADLTRLTGADWFPTEETP